MVSNRIFGSCVGSWLNNKLNLLLLPKGNYTTLFTITFLDQSTCSQSLTFIIEDDVGYIIDNDSKSPIWKYSKEELAEREDKKDVVKQFFEWSLRKPGCVAILGAFLEVSSDPRVFFDPLTFLPIN